MSVYIIMYNYNVIIYNHILIFINTCIPDNMVLSDFQVKISEFWYLGFVQFWSVVHMTGLDSADVLSECEVFGQSVVWGIRIIYGW